MEWTQAEIIALLRHAKEVGALAPRPGEPDPLLGAEWRQQPDTGTDPAGGPVNEPVNEFVDEPHPGPEA